MAPVFEFFTTSLLKRALCEVVGAVALVYQLQMSQQALLRKSRKLLCPQILNAT